MRQIALTMILWLFVLNSCVTQEAALRSPPQVIQIVSVVPKAGDLDALKVELAMAVLANTEKQPLQALMVEPGKVAKDIVDQANKRHIDPMILVAMAWRESRDKATAVGDHGKSCGIFQIQSSKAYKGRPSCHELLDTGFSANWAANFLTQYPLEYWNGKAYAEHIRKTVQWLKIHGT